MPFSALTKRAEIVREIQVRERVYPGWITQGKLTQELAAKRIKILQEIAEDYAQAAVAERLI